jgi:hypothetical protein
MVSTRIPGRITVLHYGLIPISLPVYVVAQSTLLPVMVAVALGAHWIVSPDQAVVLRGAFLELHETAFKFAPWAIDVFIWTPVALLVAAIPEVIETAVILDRFRTKYRIGAMVAVSGAAVT